jgi:uncharacterized protein
MLYLSTVNLPCHHGRWSIEMLRLKLDEIQEGSYTLDLECSSEEIDLEPEYVSFTSNVAIELSLFRQITKIFIKAITSVDAELECSRCLDRVPIKLEAITQVQYYPLPKVAHDKIDAIGIGYYTDEYIDLSDEIRESLLLEVPMTVLCSEDCKGLCLQCGQNLNRVKCNCSKPEILSDNRSSAFAKLLEIKR